ncbi:MAG: hypothetical protein ACI8W7_001275 [Gammaproteobacteria bacterium]|jgi:hypothetical protein
MKSNNESSRTPCIAASVLGILSCAASYADGGHSAPANGSAQQHVHLFDQVIVSPSWLLMLGLAALAVSVLVVQRRRVRAKAH